MSEQLTPWELFKKGEKDAIKNGIVNPRMEEQLKEEDEAVKAEDKNAPRPARPWDLLNKNIGRVTEEVAAERLAICKNCPSLRKKINQCKECGCFMVEKVKLPNAFCPLGKWQVAEAAPIEI